MSAPKHDYYSATRLENTSLKKVPPQNHDAELAVLGAILLENQGLFMALEVLSAGDFHRLPHQTLFQTMQEMIEAGQAVDLLTLVDELTRRKTLDDVGGAAFLASLVDVVPSAANIVYHARIVHNTAVARRLLNTSIEIATRCYDYHEDIHVLTEEAQTRIFDITVTRESQDFSSISEIVQECYDETERRQLEGGPAGIPTGFYEYDRMTGGLLRSDFILWAARPSMGKTAKALAVARNIAIQQRRGVAFFSLEMSKRQLGTRLLCMEGRINSEHIRNGTLSEDEWAALSQASEVLNSPYLFVNDSSTLTPADLRAKTKRLSLEHEIAVVIVDYLQLMHSAGKHENRQQEITYISRQLKALAKELDFTVIALSQLSRACEQRSDKRPQLSDLRESGSQEQDADLVMFIYRPDVYFDDAPEGIAEMILSKQRNGPTGTFNEAFFKQYTRFDNLEIHRPFVKQERNPFS